MERFVDSIGKTISPTSINNDSIRSFKKLYSGIHKNGGMNCNLRGIKCFLNWAVDEGHIKKMPKIKMLDVDKDIVRYITEAQWDNIMDLGIDDFWKNTFNLYRDIGYRQKELVMSELEGEFLLTSAKYCKGKRGKRKRLTSEQIEAFKGLHNLREQYLKNGQSLKTLLGRLYNMFIKSLKMIGIEQGKGISFHSIRHTFAVRRYLQTRDLYQVCKEMSHSSIRVTEDSYADFDLDDIAIDFPSLSNTPENAQKETPMVETPLRLYKTASLYN